MDDSADYDLLRSVCRRGIPPVPSPALRTCLAEVDNDSLSTDQMADLLASESWLEFGVLSLANLPLFSGPRKIKTLRQAVVQIGRVRLSGLLWTLALSQTLQQHTERHPRVRDRLWRHSILTGVLTQHLLNEAELEEPGVGMSAGMAHDIGHLLMASPAPQLGVVWHEEHDRLVERRPSPAPEYDHCRLGASLLRFWDAPEALIAAALHHHDPARAEGELIPLVTGVRLADLLAEHLHVQHAPRLLLEDSPAWNELQQLPPWNAVSDLPLVAVSSLPEALIVTEHLTNLLHL